MACSTVNFALRGKGGPNQDAIAFCAPPRNCIETVQTVVETSVETVANYIETVDYSLTMV